MHDAHWQLSSSLVTSFLLHDCSQRKIVTPTARVQSIFSSVEQKIRQVCSRREFILRRPEHAARPSTGSVRVLSGFVPRL